MSASTSSSGARVSATSLTEYAQSIPTMASVSVFVVFFCFYASADNFETAAR